jgi:hypothetical protein
MFMVYVPSKLKLEAGKINEPPDDVTEYGVKGVEKPVLSMHQTRTELILMPEPPELS